LTLVSIPPERLARWLDGFADRHGPFETAASAIELVVTAADGARARIEVPFPPLAELSRPLTALQVHANKARRVGVLLVRRGGYAAGVFDGTELLRSKVGSAYVQGRTKAGGQSQQRFANRRANQARAAFEEAADVAVRILLPVDYGWLACGGDRLAVESVLEDVRLAPLRPLRYGPLLAVPDPRLRVLTATPAQFRAIRIEVTDP